MNRIPDEFDMEQAVRGWMRDEEVRPADRSRQVGRIMGRVDETHQRRGAWRFLPFGHGAKRVDKHDDELFVAGSDAVAVRRGASSAMAVAVLAVLIVIAAALVALVPRAFEASTGAASPATLDELIELELRAWSGETELLSEVYAPEGVHTATFYDRTNEHVGPEQISLVARGGAIELIGPRIDIPAAEGEWRWAGFGTLGGGTACLMRAVDGMITRHDCVLPETSSDARAPVGLADAEASAAIDEVYERLNGSWGRGTSIERLAEVYAPDAVHTARYLNRTLTYTGPEEILRVAGSGSGAITQIGERVDFEAPEGELAWAEVSSIAGGSVCLYRAVDGMITRHDCVLPISG